MRFVAASIAAAALLTRPALADNDTAPLRFAWPPHGDAVVELTDERSVGEERRTIVTSMKLHVEPDGASGRLVVRLSDARLVSIDGATPGETDPAHMLLAVGRVMKRITPTMVVDADGRYLETRELDRLAAGVLAAAGFPAMPLGADVFGKVLGDVAVADWNAWVGAWIGRGVPDAGPGATAGLTASAVYPSESVREYTAGFLVDMAREAQELGDDDPVASVKFLEKATYSDVTETLTVAMDPATMRPTFAERTRTFAAVHGKHRVEGRERRTHRFTWATETTEPASP